MTKFVPLLTLCLFLVACASPSSPDAVPAGAITVVGTVHHYTIEGGFWAVRGDDGVTYDPLGGLPADFQQENLRVSMVARIRSDLSGIHMVGPIVEILRIRRL
jgi:hypothetical protein